MLHEDHGSKPKRPSPTPIVTEKFAPPPWAGRLGNRKAWKLGNLVDVAREAQDGCRLHQGGLGGMGDT